MHQWQSNDHNHSVTNLTVVLQEIMRLCSSLSYDYDIHKKNLYTDMRLVSWNPEFGGGRGEDSHNYERGGDACRFA